MKKWIASFLIMTMLAPYTAMADPIPDSAEEGWPVSDERVSDEWVSGESVLAESVQDEADASYTEEYTAAIPEESTAADLMEDPEIVHYQDTDGLSEMNEYGLIEESFFEETDADGNILPVHGFEITEDTAENLVGAALPSSHIPGRSATIGDQGTAQNCWAYTALSCGEHNLLMDGYPDMNFSEKHLLYGYFNRDGDSGLPSGGRAWYNTTGSMYMPVAALADLLGAADEKKYPFTRDVLDVSSYRDDIAHLDEAIFLPNYPTDSASWKTDAWDAVTNAIKTVVLENGAVWISAKSAGKTNQTKWCESWPYTMNGNVKTYGAKPTADHAVTIVGWHDAMEIPGTDTPGAWYVQNSWGADWGDNGYFWISYEDASLTNPVTYRMEHAELGKTRDTRVYSHTGTGYAGAGIKGGTKIAGLNVFTADTDITIDRAGFYTSSAAHYMVELIKDGATVAKAEGDVSGAGFHKADLNKATSITKGSKFSVKTTCTNAGKYQVTFEGQSSSLRRITCEEGASFLCIGDTEYDCATATNAGGIDLSSKYHSPCIYAYGYPTRSLAIAGCPAKSAPGKSFPLYAVLKEGDEREYVTPVWSSSSKNATISKDGKVTLAAGAVSEVVTFTAVYDGLKKTCKSTVEAFAGEKDVKGYKCIKALGKVSYLAPSPQDEPILTSRTNPFEVTYKEGDFYLQHVETGLYLGSNFTDKLAPWKILKTGSGYLLQSGGKYLMHDGTIGTNDMAKADVWDIPDTKLDVADAAITLPVSAAYTGTPVTPAVKVAYGVRVLTDIDVAYKDNDKAGKMTVKISGKGIATGCVTKTVTLVASAKSVTSGKNYMLVPVKAPNKAVTVEKGNVLPKTRIYLSSQSGSEAQKFIFTKNSNGTYTITDQKSDFVAGIRNNSTANASSLETQLDTENPLQRWKLKKQDDGSYTILNAKTGKAVYLVGGKTENGTYIAQAEYSGSNNQRFYLIEVSATAHTYSKTFTIRPASKTGLSLEIAGASMSGGANAQLGTGTQKFRLMYSGGGYYRIMSIKSNKVLGIKGDTASNGTNVRQAEWRNTPGQKWKITKTKDGSYTFKSALGTALDVYGGRMVSKANIDSWSANGTNAQKWKLQ